jgi:hypothetical protein
MGKATFTLTLRQDNYGAMIFRLRWGETSIDCISGMPNCPPVPPGEDSPGSCRPIPQGLYTIGLPVHESESGWDDAIGPDWIPLGPLTPIGGRDGFLFHRDWNYLRSPGTAGCIAPCLHEHMNQITEAVLSGALDTLEVDYGF